MNAIQPVSAQSSGAELEPGWSAELELGFDVVAGRSVLVHKRHDA